MFNDGGGTTLFVGDLASFCDEKHIQEVFLDHGFDVIDVKLMRGKQSMSTLNYGFVQLRSNADAMKAIAVLDSKLIHGRKLRVNWAQPNMKVNRPIESNNSVYVKFQALTPDQIVTEERLRDIFSTFGPVIDVSIKSAHLQAKPADERDSGYGFVHFCDGNEGVAAAFKSIASLTMNSVYNDVEYVVEASQNFLKQVQNSHKGKLSTPTQNHGRTNAPQHGLHRSQNDDAQSPFSTEMNSYQQTPTNESFHTYTPTQRSYKQPNMNGKFRPQNAPDQYRFSQPQQTQQMYQQQFQQRSVQRMPTQHTPVQYGYPSHSSSPYTPQVDYNHMAPSRGPVYYDRQVPVMSGPMQFMPAMYPPSPDQYGYPNNGTFQQVFSPPMQMQPRQIIGSFEASSRHNGVPEDPRQTRQISSDSTPHHNSSPLRQSSQEKMHSQERDDYDRQQDLYESYTSPTLRRSGLAQAQTDELPGPGLSFGLGVVDPPTHSGYDDSNRYVSVNEKRNHSLSPPLDSPPGLTAQGDISSLMQTMKISPEDNSFGRRLNTVID